MYGTVIDRYYRAIEAAKKIGYKMCIRDRGRYKWERTCEYPGRSHGRESGDKTFAVTE